MCIYVNSGSREVRKRLERVQRRSHCYDTTSMSVIISSHLISSELIRLSTDFVTNTVSKNTTEQA